MEGLERALCPDHLPAVLSRREVIAHLDKPEPPFRRIGEILYGSGLRLLECLSVRVKDVDLKRHPIMVCPAARGTTTARRFCRRGPSSTRRSAGIEPSLKPAAVRSTRGAGKRPRHQSLLDA